MNEKEDFEAHYEKTHIEVVNICIDKMSSRFSKQDLQPILAIESFLTSICYKSDLKKLEQDLSIYSKDLNFNLLFSELLLWYDVKIVNINDPSDFNQILQYFVNNKLPLSHRFLSFSNFLERSSDKCWMRAFFFLNEKIKNMASVNYEQLSVKKSGDSQYRQSKDRINWSWRGCWNFRFKYTTKSQLLLSFVVFPLRFNCKCELFF